MCFVGHVDVVEVPSSLKVFWLVNTNLLKISIGDSKKTTIKNHYLTRLTKVIRHHGLCFLSLEYKPTSIICASGIPPSTIMREVGAASNTYKANIRLSG